MKDCYPLWLADLSRGRHHSPPSPPGGNQDRSRRLMELAAELFSPSIIWLLWRVETPAAPRSSSRRGRRCRIDFWHFSLLPSRGRPPPPPLRLLLYFWLFCAPFNSGFSTSILSEAREKSSKMKWNETRLWSNECRVAAETIFLPFLIWSASWERKR